MSINYPSTNINVINVTSSVNIGGGGGGEATSIFSASLSASGPLVNGDILKYDGLNWTNVQPQQIYLLSLLAYPTEASSSIEKELTRISLPFGPSKISQGQLFGTYRIDNDQTGTIVFSGPDGLVTNVVSGTAEAQVFAFETNIEMSGSRPYKLFASSSDTSSNFTIYNIGYAFVPPG